MTAAAVPYEPGTRSGTKAPGMYVHVPVIPGTYRPVAPVVQVVNLEFYVFGSWVRAPGGSDFDFICKNRKKGFNC